MSVTVETAKAWCDEAKRLMGLKKGKTQELVDTLGKAKTMITGGKPPEVSDDEWKLVSDAVAVAESSKPSPKDMDRANRTSDRQGHDDSFPGRKGVLLEGVAEQLTAVMAKVTSRKKALSELAALEQPDDPVKLSTALDARGQKRLGALDDPAAAFTDLKALMVRLATAKADLPGLTDFIATDETDPLVSACESEALGLELDNLREDIKELEEIVTAAKLRQTKLAGFKRMLKKQPNKEEPGSEADWIKLLEKTRDYYAMLPAFALAVSSAASKPTKAQQLLALQAPTQQALDDWPALPVADRLSERDADGKLAWIQKRIDRLNEPAPDSPEDKKNKQDEKEWTAMLADIAVGWNAFVNSGFSPALRGVDLPKSLKTVYVNARMRNAKTFKAAGRTFTKSDSRTAGVSWKTSYPKPPGGYPTNANGDTVASFIYHM